jgi:hypothetical protein
MAYACEPTVVSHDIAPICVKQFRGASVFAQVASVDRECAEFDLAKPRRRPTGRIRSMLATAFIAALCRYFDALCGHSRCSDV